MSAFRLCQLFTLCEVVDFTTFLTPHGSLCHIHGKVSFEVLFSISSALSLFWFLLYFTFENLGSEGGVSLPYFLIFFLSECPRRSLCLKNKLHK